MNPADDASRGLSPETLNNDHRWLHGPDFLWQHESEWAITKIEPLAEDHPEIKEVKVNVLTNAEEDEPRENAFEKLIKDAKSVVDLSNKTAQLLKRIGKIGLVPDANTPEGIDEALIFIVEEVQREHFDSEIEALENKVEIKRSSRIVNLTPLLVGGVLRVGGRLDNAPTLSEESKHPIILPKSHPLSELVIKDAHVTFAHAGREQTLAETRKRFWVIGGRCLAKKAIRGCIHCNQDNARPMEQVMASLPRCRLVPYKPSFNYTGVDLFGPLLVNEATVRQRDEDAYSHALPHAQSTLMLCNR